MRRKILDVNVDFGLTTADTLRLIKELIHESPAKGETHLISTTGPYFIMSAQKDSEFKNIVNNAKLSVPDGVGTLYANYYLSQIENLPRGLLFPFRAFITGIKAVYAGYFNKKVFGERVTGVELTDELCKMSGNEGFTVFFLGGGLRDKKGRRVEHSDYDMAKDAANIIMKKYPKIRFIGATSEFSRNPSSDAVTLDYIHSCMNRHGVDHIDILLVAYEPIHQEKWIQRNANKIPATVSLGIGRTFDYITNNMKQPNKIYEKLYLSWLYALLLQPWRIKRILMSFPTFPIQVYLESIKK